MVRWWHFPFSVPAPELCPKHSLSGAISHLNVLPCPLECTQLVVVFNSAKMSRVWPWDGQPGSWLWASRFHKAGRLCELAGFWGGCGIVGGRASLRE